MFNIQRTVSAQTVYHYLNEYISNSMSTAGKVFKNFNYIWLSIGSRDAYHNTCTDQTTDEAWFSIFIMEVLRTTQVVQFGNKDLFPLGNRAGPD